MSGMVSGVRIGVLLSECWNPVILTNFCHMLEFEAFSLADIGLSV